YNSILELIQNMKNQYLKFSSLTKVQQSITFAFPKKSDLKTSEINKIPVEIDDNSFFRNKAVVFTGDFEIGKDELKIIVRKNGAFIRNDVSPRIDILVEGIQQERFKDENGLVSKQRKARNLINQGSNIQIINEVELLNLVKEVEI
ncbi:ATP-dependent helicase, partial [Staphylococcus simulans]